MEIRKPISKDSSTGEADIKNQLQRARIILGEELSDNEVPSRLAMEITKLIEERDGSSNKDPEAFVLARVTISSDRVKSPEKIRYYISPPEKQMKRGGVQTFAIDNSPYPGMSNMALFDRGSNPYGQSSDIYSRQLRTANDKAGVLKDMLDAYEAIKQHGIAYNPDTVRLIKAENLNPSTLLAKFSSGLPLTEKLLDRTAEQVLNRDMTVAARSSEELRNAIYADVTSGNIHCINSGEKISPEELGEYQSLFDKVLDLGHLTRKRIVLKSKYNGMISPMHDAYPFVFNVKKGQVVTSIELCAPDQSMDLHTSRKRGRDHQASLALRVKVRGITGREKIITLSLMDRGVLVSRRFRNTFVPFRYPAESIGLRH